MCYTIYINIKRNAIDEETMKKILGVVGIVLVLCLCSLSGCLDEKSKFIGTWKTQDESVTMTFDSKNKVTITGSGPLGFFSLSGVYDYSLADQKITFLSGGSGITLNYSFPESNQLLLSNDQGASFVLTKQ
jgi:hypothetical protein